MQRLFLLKTAFVLVISSLLIVPVLGAEPQSGNGAARKQEVPEATLLGCKLVVASFVKAVEGLDAGKVKALFLAETEMSREWCKDVAKEKKRKRRIEIKISVQSGTFVPATSLKHLKKYDLERVKAIVRLEAKVGIAVLKPDRKNVLKRRIQFKANTWYIWVGQLKGGKYLLIDLSDETYKQARREMRLAGKASDLLKRAVNARDYSALCAMFGAQELEIKKMTEQQRITYLSKHGAKFLIEASMVKPMTIEERGSQRHSDGVLLTIAVLHGRKVVSEFQVFSKYVAGKDRRYPFLLNVIPKRRELGAQGKVPARDFWDAVLMANCFGIVEGSAPAGTRSRRPQYKIVGSLPVAECQKVPQGKLEVDRSTGRSMRNVGRYAVPLIRTGEKIIVVPGSYRKLQLSGNDAQDKVTLVITKLRINKAKMNLLQLLEILQDTIYSSVQTDTLSALRRSGIFDQKLTNDDHEMIEKFLADKKGLAPAAKMSILSSLAYKNYAGFKKHYKNVLLAGPAPTTLAMARSMQMHDSADFKKCLREWLSKKETRNVALTAGLVIIKRDKEFVSEVTKIFDPSKATEVMLFLPYLMNAQNKIGMGQIAALFKTSKDLKVLASVLQVCLRVAFKKPNPDLQKAVRGFLGRIGSFEANVQRHMVAGVAVTVLAKGGSKGDISAALQYIDKIASKDKQASLIIMANLGMIARKRFTKIEECRKWLSEIGK
jgi:hypothetical protein